jgi:hypothetical protein
MGQDRKDREGGGAHVTVPARGDDPSNPPAPPGGGITENGHRPQPPAETPAYPGAPPSAPSFEDEIQDAVEYERGLAVKALLALCLVALVLVIRVAFFG